MIKLLVALCLLATTLLGCVSQGTEQSPLDSIKEGFQGGTQEFSPRFLRLAEAEAPALQVAFIDTKLATILLLESHTNGIDTYLSPEGSALLFEQGMLAGTRGFGTGLLASDLSAPLALVLSGREGFPDRLMTYLDGNDRAVTRTFRCKVTVEGDRVLKIGNRHMSTRLVSEDCGSLNGTFRNLYWVDRNTQRIVQSRQWAGEYTGEISTRLVQP
jgi:hypothetical protein